MSTTRHLNYRILPTNNAPCVPGRFSVVAGKFLNSTLKIIFSRARSRQLRAYDRGQDTPMWRALNNRLQKRFALPYLMVTAPRWNTHAQILTAGPFRHAGGRIRFDGPSSGNWTSWSLVVYEVGSGRTVDFLSSGNDVREIELSAGIYGVGLRLYEAEGTIELPAVIADAPIVAPQVFDTQDLKSLESQIFGKTTRFYRLLNAPMTRQLAKTLGGHDVDLAEAFLPVGNPDTLFIFGSAQAGDKIQIGTKSVPDTAQCFLTSYNTASFPVSSISIPADEKTIHAIDKDGSFLIRIVVANGTAKENLDLLDRTEVDIVS